MKRYIKAAKSSDIESVFTSLSKQFSTYSKEHSDYARIAYKDDDEYSSGYEDGMAEAYNEAASYVRSVGRANTSTTKDNIENTFVSLSDQFLNYAKEHYKYAKRAYEDDDYYQRGYEDGATEAYDDIASYVMSVGEEVCGYKSKKTSTKKNSSSHSKPTKYEVEENLTDSEINAQIEKIVGKDYLVRMGAKVSDLLTYAKIIKETSDTYIYKDIFNSDIPWYVMHGDEIRIEKDADDRASQELLQQLTIPDAGCTITQPKEIFFKQMYKPIKIIKVVYV